VLWDGSRAEVNDLGSTNGSQLNGAPVKRAPLPADSVISIGRTRIVFRVLAQSSSIDQYSDLRVDPPTRNDGGRR
jgi:pSer/pThr/pTyr-binding forkhead associated (FHA) protein